MTTRPLPQRSPTTPLPGLLRAGRSSLAPIPEVGLAATRRPSVSGSNMFSVNPKIQRTSKTSQKLVVLPSEPQTKPLPGELQVEDGSEETLINIMGTKDYKSEGERMTKSERYRAGYKRLTAYCISESFRMKLLGAFLKREHNVVPRVFDEAVFVMYHMPLLPGYGPNVNVRSSVPAKSPGGKSIQSRLFEAEENGYQGGYFTTTSASESEGFMQDGFIPSSSPEGDTRRSMEAKRDTRLMKKVLEEQTAEVIFFAYGVVVFFGLDESQERSIIEDLDSAGILVRRIEEDTWEIEECHYSYDPNVAYPRIYNDLFTLKSHSHLLKISISHALAQSTLLARYESKVQLVLSDQRTTSIPRQLASSGELKLRRREALRLTGTLFKLRRDINLVSNVLDVPELFWSEASLKDLYDAVREYLEISPRVQVLNEKLTVASDLLDLIHGHLNNSAMERITWIIIWLIVVACLVELGEVIARLVVHATTASRESLQAAALQRLSRAEALTILENMLQQPS